MVGSVGPPHKALKIGALTERTPPPMLWIDCGLRTSRDVTAKSFDRTVRIIDLRTDEVVFGKS